MNGNQVFLMQQFQRMEQRNLAMHYDVRSPQPSDLKLQQHPVSISRGSSGAGPSIDQTKHPLTVPVASLNSGESRELPHMTEPGKYDVICARYVLLLVSANTTVFPYAIFTSHMLLCRSTAEEARL